MMGRIDMDYKDNLGTSDSNTDKASVASQSLSACRQAFIVLFTVQHLKTKNIKSKTHGSQKIN